MRDLKLQHVRKSKSKSCSQCEAPLIYPSRERITELTQLMTKPSTQCTVCKQYSCRSWNGTSDCPDIVECDWCLESVCSCRQVLRCNYCFKYSCSECNDVHQCVQCNDASCHWVCARGIFIGKCGRCNETHCQTCRMSYYCDRCDECVCEWCGIVDYCGCCRQMICNECRHTDEEMPFCLSCEEKFCEQCVEGTGIKFEECPYCQLKSCGCDSSFLDSHSCISPGEALYSARDAREGDDENALCACGRKHLSAGNGQQFMCAWLAM